jgi:hypothetical protein
VGICYSDKCDVRYDYNNAGTCVKKSKSAIEIGEGNDPVMTSKSGTLCYSSCPPGATDAGLMCSRDYFTRSCYPSPLSSRIKQRIVPFSSKNN